MRRLLYVTLLVLLLSLGSQEGRSTSPKGFLTVQAQTQVGAEASSLTPEVKPMHWSVDDIRRVHAQRVAGRENDLPLANAPMYEMRVVHHSAGHATPTETEFTKIKSKWVDAKQHSCVSDFYVILGGGGTIVVGGSMENKVSVAGFSCPAPGEFRGQPVVGGTSYTVKEGDWLLIPPHTPHWPQPDSGGLTYMVLQIREGEPYTRSVQPTPTTYSPLEPVFWSDDDLRKVHDVAASGESIRALLPLPKMPMYALYLLHRPHYSTPRPSRVVEVGSQWGDAEQHARVTDFYLIRGGTGTILVGGEIENRVRIPDQAGPVAGEYRGQPVKGGQAYRVKAGDWLLIPPNTPHQSQPDPGGLTFAIVQIKEGAPYAEPVGRRQ